MYLFYALWIIVFSFIDSFFTLSIINSGGIELNPIMDMIIEIDNILFVFIKAFIVLISVSIFYKYRHYKFLNLFYVKFIIKIVFYIYLMLIIYEGILIYYLEHV